jgi:hypothetical protein
MKKLNLNFFFVFFALFSQKQFAQIVGNDAYIKGNHAEIGIRGQGGFEGVDIGVSPPPAGSHPRSSTNLFGFVANPQVNGWSTFDGDFFTPGSPENGWGFEIGDTGPINRNNNCSGPQIDLPGMITSYSNIGSCISVTWEAHATSGTDLNFTINYAMSVDDLYYITTVSVKNNTSATIPLMYYYKNFDPDNNEELFFDFTTQNTVVNQPYNDSCKIAHVSATQTTPWNSYIALLGLGDQFRVAHGGFSNRDASDLWNGAGFNSAVGSSVFMDEAIAIAYRIQNLAPGATESFKFVTILDVNAIPQALNKLISLSHQNVITTSPTAVSNNCSYNYVDTVFTCGDSVGLFVSNSVSNLFDWQWSPATGLSSTNGPSVLAFPSDTALYTLTGIPNSGCFDTVHYSIVVIPNQGITNIPVIDSVPQLCLNSSPITLIADSVGGIWSGLGITNQSSGIFNPYYAGIGTHLITYSYTNQIGCSAYATQTITVVNCVGVLEFAIDNDFVIYPNPTQSMLHVSLLNTFKNASLTVYDVTGRLVKAVDKITTNDLAIDISDLESGMYLISLQTDNNVVTKRFVKQ